MGSAFDVAPLTPAIGSVVTGLDLSHDMSDAVMLQLVHMLHERSVVVIKEQTLTDADFVRFGYFWGRPTEFFIAEHRKKDHPEMIRIDNDPSTPVYMRDAAVHWHSDNSYEKESAAVTILYGREAPDEGGYTHFASTAAACEALPDDRKAILDPLVAVHDLGAAPWIDGETPPDAARPKRNLPLQRHPLIGRHPVTGRKAIFTSGTAFAIDGLEQEEATRLIRELRAYVVQPRFRCSYKVLAGDIALWDNFTTVHSSSPIEYSREDGKRRLLYRISTKGMPALCAVDVSSTQHCC